MIFLDHMMPEKDGIETLHELQSQQDNPNRFTPVVCLTANAISGARERYLAEGFDDYLTKPIDSAKLEEMLMQYLPGEKIRRSEAEEETLPGGAQFPEALSALEGQNWIDLTDGLNHSGSPEAYLSLLNIFCAAIDEKAEEIEQFYRSGDFENYTIRVHALKSSARIIGASAFGEEAQRLENAGRSGDRSYIRAHHAAFLAGLRAMKEPLSRVFAAQSESQKPEADSDMMEDALAELRCAAEDMDCGLMKDVLEEMGEYRIPQEYAALWSRLEEAAGRYDYDGILALLPED